MHKIGIINSKYKNLVSKYIFIEITEPSTCLPESILNAGGELRSPTRQPSSVSHPYRAAKSFRI